MTCRAEIFTATKGGVLAAPIQSILVEEDLTTDAVSRDVFVSRDGRAVKTSVQVGIADDTYQEIVSGLQAGDDQCQESRAAARSGSRCMITPRKDFMSAVPRP